MDTYQCIVSKRDTRSYLDQPIEEEKLGRVLQAGRMAGSSKNTQPVRLVVLRDKAWMQEVAACGKFSEPLKAAAAGGRNLMPPLLDCARRYVSLGETSDALTEVFGQYREQPFY